MFKILLVRLPMSPKVDINVYRTNLLHCAFCVPYPSLISTLRAYAPYPSLISALGGLRAFTLINKRLTRLCIVLLQIPLCLSAPCKKVSYSNERIWTYSKMQFFCWKPPFWASLAQKSICQSKLKFGILTHSNMQNSMVMFTSVSDQKYPFWVNSVQNFKAVNLS